MNVTDILIIFVIGVMTIAICFPTVMDTDPIFHYTNKTVHIIDKYETHAFLDNQNVVKTQYGEQVVYSDYDQFVIGNDYNVTVDGTNSIYGLSKNMWK